MAFRHKVTILLTFYRWLTFWFFFFFSLWGSKHTQNLQSFFPFIWLKLDLIKGPGRNVKGGKKGSRRKKIHPVDNSLVPILMWRQSFESSPKKKRAKSDGISYTSLLGRWRYRLHIWLQVSSQTSHLVFWPTYLILTRTSYKPISKISKYPFIHFPYLQDFYDCYMYKKL